MIITNKEELEDLKPWLRSRIFSESNCLVVDLYRYNDATFNYEHWEANCVRISFNCGFKLAYQCARILIRAHKLDPDGLGESDDT